MTTTLTRGVATMDETFNGWTNRETWCLMSYINNVEGLHMGARLAVHGLTGVAADDSFREWVESLFTRAGFADAFGVAWPDELADIAGEVGSLWRVNWTECAESILEP